MTSFHSRFCCFFTAAKEALVTKQTLSSDYPLYVCAVCTLNTQTLHFISSMTQSESAGSSSVMDIDEHGGFYESRTYGSPLEGQALLYHAPPASALQVYIFYP